MKKIAITGGIASGKSTLLKILSELGQVVLSCDDIVQNLYEDDQTKRELVKLLGEDILDQDGRLNRRKILEKIVADPILKKRLENFIHEKVWAYLERRFKEYEPMGIKAVFVEVPLLFEAGWEYRFDEIWVVSCQMETQIKRLLEQGRSHHLPFIDKQFPLEEKVKKAHRVFSSEVPITELKKEVEKILSQFCN